MANQHAFDPRSPQSHFWCLYYRFFLRLSSLSINFLIKMHRDDKFPIFSAQSRLHRQKLLNRRCSDLIFMFVFLHDTGNAFCCFKLKDAIKKILWVNLWPNTIQVDVMNMKNVYNQLSVVVSELLIEIRADDVEQVQLNFMRCRSFWIKIEVSFRGKL